MLKKKPHYAKYFTELEDDIDDNQLFLMNHASMRNAQDPAANISGTSSGMEFFRNRISSMFQNNKSCALEGHNTGASNWEEAPLGFTPKLTREDLMSFERPDADKHALESALDALDDANFTMIYPMIRRLSKIQDNM